MKYIMALDQGTSSSRCILFDKQGQIVSTAQKQFTQYYPSSGWVEHDAMELWAAQIGVAREAMLRVGVQATEIAAIGIANQRETTVVWERDTGRPVHPAIVWQCRRTADMCAQLRAQGKEEFFQSRTGLLIDAYFSATKVKWILEKVDGARERAARGELLFGTIETWLIWNLTGGKVHATDCSNASRTMLFNIHTLSWDEDILALLDIPKAMLPKVVSSSEHIGTSITSLFGAEIPICAAAGDQQAALFGQCCFEAGQVKNTYGTGAFLLKNTGEVPVSSSAGLLTTIAWRVDGKTTYALEGSVFVAGAVIQWLRDELGLISSAEETQALARSVQDTGGVYTVPAFVGLGAPHWNAQARGAIVGLTRGSSRAHIVRSALESIAYQVAEVLALMEQDAGHPITEVKADGGASANDFLMQFQADILGKPVLRPHCVETTARGAAFLAGLAVGFWSSMAEIAKLCSAYASFDPSMPQKQREHLLHGWKTAVQRTLLHTENSL